MLWLGLLSSFAVMLRRDGFFPYALEDNARNVFGGLAIIIMVPINTSHIYVTFIYRFVMQCVLVQSSHLSKCIGGPPIGSLLRPRRGYISYQFLYILLQNSGRMRKLFCATIT